MRLASERQATDDARHRRKLESIYGPVLHQQVDDALLERLRKDAASGLAWYAWWLQQKYVPT